MKEVLTPVSGCHLTVRNAAVFFPPDGGKNFFGFSGIKKGAKLRFFGALRLAWRFSVGLYDYSAGCVQRDVNNIFSECFHRGGGCVVGLQHFGDLCACVLSAFRQAVFFRL